jgi:hypothetical protein
MFIMVALYDIGGVKERGEGIGSQLKVLGYMACQKAVVGDLFQVPQITENNRNDINLWARDLKDPRGWLVINAFSHIKKDILGIP